MKNLQNLTYKTLYQLWAGLFAVTALLGLAFPGVEPAAGRFFLALISGVFFLPPFAILTRAKKEGNLHHLRLVRYLALASLVMTMLCAPLVCSNYYALPMVLWAMLFYGSFGKKK